MVCDVLSGLDFLGPFWPLWPFWPLGRLGRSVSEDLAGRLGLPPGEYPVAGGVPGGVLEAAARSFRRVSGVRPEDPPGEPQPPGEADEAAAELTLLLTMSRGADRAPDCPPPPPLLLRDESGGRPEDADPAAEGELLRPDGDTVLLRGERPFELWWWSPLLLLNPDVTLGIEDPLLWDAFPFPTTEFLGLGLAWLLLPSPPLLPPLEALVTAGEDSLFKFPGMFHTHSGY